MQLAIFLGSFCEDTFYDRVPTANFYFGHVVITHADFPHPLEGRLVQAARAQPDLDIVGAAHMSFIDQAIDRVTMMDQVTIAAPPGVIVRVEMNDRHLLFAVHVGKGSDIRIFERVITAHDERDRAGGGNFPHHLSYVLHGTLGAVVIDCDVAIVDDVEFATGIDHRILIRAAHVSAVQSQIRCCLSAGIPPARTHVQRCTKNRNIHLGGNQVLHGQGHRVTTEGRRSATTIVAAQRQCTCLASRVH